MMKIRIRMCNLCFRDMARNNGWENQNLLCRLKNVLTILVVYRKKFWAILCGKYSYLRQIEFVLTTKCSLRCRDCANLMQYYKKPYDVEARNIIDAFDVLIPYFNEINTVVLVGGEPFLSKDISEIIFHMADFPQINHIHFFTNGTIIPDEKDIRALKNPKVKIIISDYGNLSRKKCELTDWCRKNNINFHLKSEDLQWGYVGDMQARGRTAEELQKQFKHCNNYCRSILNGKLFYCPRAAHSDDLGYVTTAYDYVDLLHGNADRASIMNIVYSSHYFSACDYCNYGTAEMVPIVPGVQMNKSGKENISEK